MLTADRRGPGRPVTVAEDDEDVLTELLRLVAEGASVPVAAAEVGWSRSGVYRMAGRMPLFRRALTAAQKQGRTVRTPPPKHGTESQHVNRRCRCERCVPAASAARAGRRVAARARTGARTVHPGE